MSPNIIMLIAIAATPVVLALLLRVSAVFVYFGIAAGALLASSIGDDVAFALEAFIKGANAVSIVSLALIAIPTLLTLYFLRKSMSAAQLILHVVPLVASGLFLATICLQNMPLGVKGAVKTDALGNIFYQSGDLIIAVASVLSLLLAWRIYRYRKDHHNHKKHK